MSVEIKVGVVPAGALGSAFAKIAADMGHQVTLYFNRPESLETFKATHRSDRLEGIDLPRSIHGTCDIQEVVKGARVLFLAPPSVRFREVFQNLKTSLRGDCDVLIGTKGLEEGTNLTMSQIVLQERPNHIDHVAVMSGPNIANQMALRKETGTVIASYQAGTAKRLQALFNTNYFRVYTEEDVIALETAGALKNIMAFGVGIVNVLDVSQNTKALYFARALAEMAMIGKVLGAQDERPFMGLSGAGDFFLSCIGQGTRNTRAGEAFARGRSLKELETSKDLVESLYTVKVAADIVRKHNLNAPITLAINGMVHEGWDKSVCIQQLMDRKPEKEQLRDKDLGFYLARLGTRLLHNIGIGRTL